MTCEIYNESKRTQKSRVISGSLRLHIKTTPLDIFRNDRGGSTMKTMGRSQRIEPTTSNSENKEPLGMCLLIIGRVYFVTINDMKSLLS